MNSTSHDAYIAALLEPDQDRDIRTSHGGWIPLVDGVKEWAPIRVRYEYKGEPSADCDADNRRHEGMTEGEKQRINEEHLKKYNL